ncbi:MAG TPA: hypothetical protein VKA91_07890 [Nitrososphaeraceae archaeon]|nr:hypothetical protein [Nitrososphaeraceae archaeon]
MKLTPSDLSIDKLIRMINTKVIFDYKEISDLQSKSDSPKTIISSIGTSLIEVQRKDTSSFMPEISFDVARTTTTLAAAASFSAGNNAPDSLSVSLPLNLVSLSPLIGHSSTT